MNTSPKLKRHTVKRPQGSPPLDGTYVTSLTNPEYALLLARVISEFVHLEAEMAWLLAVLLGSPDTEAAGYVLRAIKTPRGRIDVLKDLLEKSRQNQDRPEIYDKIINEFEGINGRRNALVHGQWFTNADTGAVYLAERDDHGWSFFVARPIAAAELQAVIESIGELHLKLRAHVHPEMVALRPPPQVHTGPGPFD